MTNPRDRKIKRADYLDAAADAIVLITGKQRPLRAVAGEVLDVIGKNWMDNKSPHQSDLKRLHQAVADALKKE